MILQTFHKPRLVEFNNSFGNQRLQDKTHNEVKNDQAPIDKHLVMSTKDPPTSKQILTQDELDDRKMVIIMDSWFKISL